MVIINQTGHSDKSSTDGKGWLNGKPKRDRFGDGVRE